MLTLLIMIIHQREMGWAPERKTVQSIQDTILLRLRGHGQRSGSLWCAHLLSSSPWEDSDELCDRKSYNKQFVKKEKTSWGLSQEWAEPHPESHSHAAVIILCKALITHVPTKHIPKETKTSHQQLPIVKPSIPCSIWKRKKDKQSKRHEGDQGRTSRSCTTCTVTSEVKSQEVVHQSPKRMKGPSRQWRKKLRIPVTCQEQGGGVPRDEVSLLQT